MDVYETLITERTEGRPCALATIVNVKGSIPSYATAKMLVREDGSIVGTIGGGAAEAEVILAAREAIATGRPEMIAFNLHDDPKLDTGMVCGGSLDVFVEPIRPAPVVYLFGAGHVGLLTGKAARLAGFDIVVVDDRPEFANAERFPEAQSIHATAFEASMAALKPNRQAMIFIATRCHELDGKVLRWAVETPAAYIGMIGSKRKVLTVFTALQADGVPVDRFERVHAPVGLDIGAETPEEIAISVVAELIACHRCAQGVRPIMRNMAALAEHVRHKEAS